MLVYFPLTMFISYYTFKKSKVKIFSEILNKSSFNDFKTNLNEFMETKYWSGFDQYSNESVDHILNRIMTYEIIFPPLAIEQKNTASLLGHNNGQDYWNIFFKDHKEEMENYVTY